MIQRNWVCTCGAADGQPCFLGVKQSKLYLNSMNAKAVACLSLTLILFFQASLAQPKNDSLMLSLLQHASSPYIREMLENNQAYRCQIIYTQINRDKKNRPSFRNYYFNTDRNLYFNPASMVKLPLAFLSMEKMNRLRKWGVQPESIMLFDSSYAGQVQLYYDSTSESGRPTLAQFIRKAFLISDNDAYNRMYQFVSQGAINRSLHQKGYPDIRITRQFMGYTDEGNRHTNPIRFLDTYGNLQYIQPPAYNTDSFDFSRKIFLGEGHWDRNDSLIRAPFDFTRHNNVPLEDLQRMLQSVLFPASVKKKQRFKIDNGNRLFLLKYLSQYPSETSYPKYDTGIFYDSYVKFFFRDSSHRMPEQVRVFNKVGWAYGFLTDVSYVADFSNQVEYMLSATIYVNKDGVLNDGKYEYDSMGHPFLRALGQLIYEYEKQRPRAYRPRLSEFNLSYDHRDPTDTRPSIRIADN